MLLLLAQLSHVQPMKVQDVYALVTLMGLYLSEASGHQKAYKELLDHIDDGHALTLDSVCVFITAGPSTNPFAWGEGGIWEDMCYERQLAETCVD
jgi:hypothetical protein